MCGDSTNSEILDEEEEHFYSVKTCRKRITWETAEIKKLFGPDDTLRMSKLSFAIGLPIGRLTRGTLQLEQIYDRYRNERTIRPSLRLASTQGMNSASISASLSLQFYSGTEKIWECKANGGASGVYEGNINFEPIPYQKLAQGILPTKETILIVFVIEFSLRADTYVAVEKATKSRGNPMQPANQLRQDASHMLLETGIGSDFVIIVPKKKGGFYSRKVHKVVLTLASPVFKAMVNSESDTLEGKDNETLIEDLSEKGLDILLEYLYTGNISPDWVQVPLEILNAAEKYQLLELKDFCKQNLQASLKQMQIIDIEQLAEVSRSLDPKAKLEELVAKGVEELINVFKLDSLTS